MTPKSGPVIIPVASGKGGVGKSFITANLALALARLGHRTVAVDLDLGGSNLHHFMGLGNRNPGIGDFLSGGGQALEGFLVDTEVPNLSFLPGDGKTPLLANLHATKKLKLMRHLRVLAADFVVLDLGAGSALTALDFFGMAERGLVVTTPELPAVMGMLVFLKNFLLRQVDRRLAQNGRRSLRPLLMDLLNRPLDEQLPSLSELRRRLEAEAPDAGKAVAAMLERCRPRVMFNLAERAEEARLAQKVQQTLNETLSIEADFFGFVFKDGAVRESLDARRPFLLHSPESLAAGNILRIAERVVKYWHQAIPDSASLIARHAGLEAPGAAKEKPARPAPARFGFLDSLASRTREALHL